MKKHLTLAMCLIAGLTGLGQAEASTTTLNFYCISTGVAADCSTGQSQLSVDVSNTTKGVSFTFKNNVGVASSITDVYFDAGASSLSGVPLPTITDSDGSGNAVSFALNATPTNLPGANTVTPPFNASTSTAFTADSANTAKGVNTATEWLTMDYALQSGQTYANVITELSNGNLRLGLHVRAFAGDGLSASFVNIKPVPVPAAAWLLGSGLIGLAGIGRRRAAAKQA